MSAKYKLAFEFLPTLREVRAELRRFIEQTVISFQEADGVVRNQEAIHSVCCLRSALDEMPKARPSVLESAVVICARKRNKRSARIRRQL